RLQLPAARLPRRQCDAETAKAKDECVNQSSVASAVQQHPWFLLISWPAPSGQACILRRPPRLQILRCRFRSQGKLAIAAVKVEQWVRRPVLEFAIEHASDNDGVVSRRHRLFYGAQKPGQNIGQQGNTGARVPLEV